MLVVEKERSCPGEALNQAGRYINIPLKLRSPDIILMPPQ